MKNQAADDARRARQEASQAKADALRKQLYPNLGETDPTDTVLDEARQARASLPLSTKIGGWVLVGFLLWMLYARIEAQPSDQHALWYWIVGSFFGVIAIFVAALWIREDLRRKRLRASQSEGPSSGK